MSIKQDEPTEAGASLYALVNELHGLITREHTEIRDELSQMGAVVSDAINTLMLSLNGLNKQLNQQNQMIQKMAVVVDTAESEQLQEEYQALNKMVSQNITVVVRSLQFEDILQQLIGHCRARSEGLEGLVDQLNLDVNMLQNAPQEKVNEVMSGMQAKISEVGEKLKKENPVKQTSMGAGRIELF